MEDVRAMIESAAHCGRQLPRHDLRGNSAVITVVSLILALWGCFWLGPLCVDAMRPSDGRVNDYYQDWGSARNHLVGLPVYTEHAISIRRHLGLALNPVTSIDYNAHPPTSVLLALPLARLSYPDAVLAWNAISLVAFLVSLVIIAKVLPVPRTLYLPILALLTFCHPLYGNLHAGQLTLILVLLVTAVWALERSGWSYAAGLLLGGAVTIKLFPAYLAVYYVARRQIRPLQAAVVSCIALTLLTIAILGWDTYRDYVCVILPHQARFRSFGYNLSIAGLWHKLFDPVGERGWMTPLWFNPALARWGTVLSDLAITAGVATCAYRAKTAEQQDLAFGVMVTAMLLVSPVTWDISLPLLLVPIAVIARGAAGFRWLPAVLMLTLLLVWMPQILLTKLALGGRSLSVAPWTFMIGAPSIKFYALLAIFGLGLVALRAKTANTSPGTAAGGALP
jgi:alpha-1,2-mannosyltransferase